MAPGQTPPQSAQIARLDEKIDNLISDVGTVNRMLMGNGQPGVIDRISKLENRYEQVINLVQQNAEASRTFASSAQEARNNISKEQAKYMADIQTEMARVGDKVEEIGESVKEHHQDQTLHSPKMFLRKDIILLVIMISVIAHAVIEQLTVEGQWLHMVLKYLGFQ